jgi:predicted phosphodiesterase
MARYAIIADIHGNLHAFQSVLARLAGMEMDAILCLGDIVGYGPFPDTCLDLVIKHCSTIVQGNHDRAVVDPGVADVFNGAARTAVLWTRDRLGPLHYNALCRLRPTSLVDGSILCVHDCPVPGPTDYVHDKCMAAMAFRGVETALCLLGHTHVPMVFEAPGMDPAETHEPHELIAYLPHDGHPIDLAPGKRYIANPGSVGQPRDSDPRASFAVLDTEARTFTVHRQEYDILAAQQATQRAGLPTILAERLALGA